MESGRQQGLRKLVLAIDALLVLGAMPLASWLHELALPVAPFLREKPSFDQYAVLAYLALPLYLSFIWAFGLNRVFERPLGAGALLRDLAKLHLAVLLAFAVLAFLTRSVVNRSLLLGMLGCTFGLLLLERTVLLRWHSFQQQTGQGRARLLVAGAVTPDLLAFVTAAREQPWPPLFVGRVSPEDSPEPGDPSLPARLGAVSELERILHAEAVDQVLFFPPLHIPNLAAPALSVCERLGIPTCFAIPKPRQLEGPARILSLYELPFVSFDAAPKRPELLALKHAFDAVAALVLLLLAFPLLLACALGVLLAMGRPIFYVQERAGLFGRRFRMLKFRTMVSGADQQLEKLATLNEMSGPVFKARDDPRVTRFGRLLRRTSLDELPQLFHVLLGTMSLVGPRPLPSHEQQQIRGWHRRRLSMKPGITGLWQVSGRNEVDFEEWMRLDLSYVDGWSPLLDLRILVKTIPAVLSGRGAR
ncbi:MAG: exopolysaccharide biosynthesis polyprenyl glycosylphosphotransferase [Myxococcales bacterium]|nr:exopolysaccharide biosynthesis polyprenyl glycosylphosphotransferase [Myxococcales bacterium]